MQSGTPLASKDGTGQPAVTDKNPMQKVYDLLDEIRWRRGANGKSAASDLLEVIARKLSIEHHAKVLMVVDFPGSPGHMIASTPEHPALQRKQGSDWERAVAAGMIQLNLCLERLDTETRQRILDEIELDSELREKRASADKAAGRFFVWPSARKKPEPPKN